MTTSEQAVERATQLLQRLGKEASFMGVSYMDPEKLPPIVQCTKAHYVACFQNLEHVGKGYVMDGGDAHFFVEVDAATGDARLLTD